MNAKKSKKLRQLVKHLTDKSGASTETRYTTKYVRHANAIKVLDSNCARAVYQQMKKNS